MKRLLFIVLASTIMPISLLCQITHTVEFPTGGLSLSTIFAEDSNYYSMVHLQDMPYTATQGNPRLPVRYVNLIIPADQSIDSISINSTVSETLSVPYQIFPVQPPLFDCMDCPDPEFVNPNLEVYNSPNPYPNDVIMLEHQGYFDGGNHSEIGCLSV
jgi:hypothetical protein